MGEIIEDPAGPGKLETVGTCPLIVYVTHPDDVGKKRPRTIPKIVGVVRHTVPVIEQAPKSTYRDGDDW